MSKHQLFDRVETVLTVVALGLVLGFSILSSILELDDRWFVPVQFGAVVLILRLVWPMASLSADVKRIDQSMKTLAAGAELARVMVYETADEFYGEAARRVRQARQRVYLTYLRRTPPQTTDLASARDYFSAINDWARADPTHSVRRIVCRPDDADEQPWFEAQYELARQLRNFDVRTMDWPVATDAINMALIDHEYAFLLIAGDQPGKLRGLSVRSAQVVGYLHDYYSGLWNSCPSKER